MKQCKIQAGFLLTKSGKLMMKEIAEGELGANFLILYWGNQKIMHNLDFDNL